MHINASELHPISFIIIITIVFRFEHFYGENYLFTTLQSVMSSCRQNSRKIIRDFFFFISQLLQWPHSITINKWIVYELCQTYVRTNSTQMAKFKLFLLHFAISTISYASEKQTFVITLNVAIKKKCLRPKR